MTFKLKKKMDPRDYNFIQGSRGLLPILMIWKVSQTTWVWHSASTGWLKTICNSSWGEGGFQHPILNSKGTAHTIQICALRQNIRTY